LSKTAGNITIIDEGLTVEGQLSGKGEMIVKGTVKGTLSGEILTIARGGEVFADVQADTVTIGGRYEGTVQARREVSVLATGACHGKVTCPNLTVAAGARMNAQISCKPAAAETRSRRKMAKSAK